MQTIIGSGGAIGIPLAKELLAYTKDIRLVSRNPKRVNPTDELYPLDVNDFAALDGAIAGSEVVYIVIGFEYKLSVWQKKWPAFMQAVIESCKKHGAKLVFFDNVYMYEKGAIPHMTESSLVQAPSKKGLIRQHIYEMVMNEVEQNTLKALITRSADFYGPDNKSSALNMMVVENLMKGKKAQAFGDINKIHTYTFTPDAAKATAQLGNTEDAYNQVWHVPTTKSLMTNLQWMELIADELKVDLKIQALPNWFIKILGLFIPIMKEFPEMMYQYEQDYVFDSSKFENRFNWAATNPKEGIKLLIESLKANS
jgi:nucleoside-diphosphate-sugar epimerase